MGELEDLTAYYQNLLIKQYYQKTKANSTIGALSLSMLSDLVFYEVRDAFNVDDAIGVQLDVLGKYVGANRYALDNTGIDDDDMRFQTKLRITKNVSDNTLKSIDDLLELYFPLEVFVLTDNKDMTMTYLFPEALSPNFLFALQMSQ